MSHFAISASNAAWLVLRYIPILNFFSPRTWSKSIQTDGNVSPQSIQGTSLIEATKAHVSCRRRRWYSAGVVPGYLLFLSGTRNPAPGSVSCFTSCLFHSANLRDGTVALFWSLELVYQAYHKNTLGVKGQTA